MTEKVQGLLLACNAGSSSLKVEVFEPASGWRSALSMAVHDIGRPSPTLSSAYGEERVAAATHREAAELVLDRLESGALVGVGHRIVHGGDAFTGPALLDAAALARLRALAELAPLHNPPALEVIAAVAARWPELPAVAVFDTAFFRSLPAHAQVYAVPRDWLVTDGVKRYGFHGIAHEYLAEGVAETRGRMPQRLLTLQLGQGCSIAALADGLPVETSMGFTPVEGLVMGTRSGDVDAGAVLHVQRRGRSADDVDDALNRHSGLLGLSGVSDDVRVLLARESEGHADAALALEVFCHRIRKYLGAYAAVLGGVDAVVFGGGIGENSAVIRKRVCAGLEWLGLTLDSQANERFVGGREGRISGAGSSVDVHVIAVRETLAIARAVQTILERAHDA